MKLIFRLQVANDQKKNGKNEQRKSKYEVKEKLIKLLLDDGEYESQEFKRAGNVNL